MSIESKKLEALHYHAKGRPGKITVVPTKETKTQKDLSLAYSPGVAEPCLEIAKQIEDVYKYTAKGNLVAVITNGTAVLGLGDIGPEASKPVMEGKGVLFKVFADIDVFDIEINEKDPKKFIEIVKSLEPTFGGINLEDIKAPECFEIEDALKKSLKIPVMHDDQHGTAIISTAGLINALEVQQKDISKVKLVVNGAGAAAISCMSLYLEVGVKMENIFLFDSKGCVCESRKDLTESKIPFAKGKKDISLADAFQFADVFIGLSKGNVVSEAMVKSMPPKPIVFAMANPDPEIPYDVATACRKDIIMATGRSDFPNQINNVLGFPYIFRGALDVKATTINEQMKLAAVYAIAKLAKEPVPSIVSMAYNNQNLNYGAEYVIPKPFDPRLLATVSPAVADAAIKSGVAKSTITDWEKYKHDLNERLGVDPLLIRILHTRAKTDPKKILYMNGEQTNVLKAATQVLEEKIAYPILMGNKEIIVRNAEANKINIEGIEIIDQRSPAYSQKVDAFGELLFHKMYRKGVNKLDAKRLMKDRVHFACMMLAQGEVDAAISSDAMRLADIISKGLNIIGRKNNIARIAGMYLLFTEKGPIFFADTNVILNPKPEDIVEICLVAAQKVKELGITPRLALLSYSNYGSIRNNQTKHYPKIIELVKQRDPSIIIDGEVQGIYAFDKKVLQENYPFSEFAQEPPNVLIFPDVASANIAYNLMQEFLQCESVGPMLLGLQKPLHVVQLGSSVRQLVNISAISVIESQNL